MAHTSGWLERYRRGERDDVWHELRQLGSRVREPELLEQAQLVCDEMARRARHNVELLVQRLTDAGYRFHSNDDERRPEVPFVPPNATAAADARWLEESFGPVPLTVLAWLRLVGDVWLVGTHPHAPRSAAADPLVIELAGTRYPGSSMRDFLAEEHAVWQEQRAEDPGTGLFVLPVAPDRLHKDNVSGGPPYGVVVPDGCADAMFVGETTMPFVSYLNGVFTHGGFPATASSGPGWWRIRQVLTQDLLPL